MRLNAARGAVGFRAGDVAGGLSVLAAAFGWSHIGWLSPWFGGMWVLSAMEDVGVGLGVLGFWPAVVLVAIWSLFVMWLAQRSALAPKETTAMMASMEAIAYSGGTRAGVAGLGE